MQKKLALASVIAAALVLQACSKPEPIDLLLTHGKVLTVDKDFSIQSTVAVKDGKIVAVGDDSMARRYKATTQIDLGGRVLMPGFNDNHLHPSSRAHRAVDAAAAHSIVELQELVKAKVQELGPGEWVTGYGWDEAQLAEKRNPVREDLDAVSPQNPVVLVRAGGHSALGNSLALKAASIDRKSPKPLLGVIEHDAKGEPNGIVRERTDMYLALVPPDTEESLRPGYVEDLKRLPALGLTSITVASASLRDEIKEQLRPGQPAGPTYKTLRGIYAEFGEDLPRATVQITYPGAAGLAAYPQRTGDGDDRIKLGAIGEGPAVDGGFTGPTAWTSQDYKGKPGFRGQAFFDESELQTLADDVAKNGWQLGLHAIGDAAINMGAKVYAEALRRHPMPDHRWYLSHFTMLPTDETLATMKAQGILGAAQPNFLYTLENRYLETLDGERLEHNNPVSLPMKKGVIISFGSDNLPIDPRVGLYAAVTRKGRSGTRVYGPEEAVSIQDAIRAYTLTTAYFTKDEKKKGSLAPGKFADMIVLDRDPLTVAPDELLTMQVDMTFIGGKRVYTRPGAK